MYLSVFRNKDFVYSENFKGICVRGPESGVGETRWSIFTSGKFKEVRKDVRKRDGHNENRGC